MPYDASNRKDVRKAEKASRLATRDDRDAIVKLMSDSFGRAWMWRRLSAARIFDDPFTGDPLVEAYNKGNRNFGMLLLSDIMRYCPEQYIQMTREATQNEQRIDNGNDSDATGSSASSEHDGSSDGGRDVEGSDSTADLADGAEDRAIH
jgi:hypothetical protein